MRSKLTTQRGAALLSALLLMALAASVATWCYVQQHLWLRQAQAMLHAERATAVLEEARAWAMQAMTNPITVRQPLRYHQKRAGFEVQASVMSEQGRFNLNAVQSSEEILHFVFLLQALDKRLSADQAIRLAYDLHAWMSPASRLERYYLGLKPPHRQAHRAMVQWNELRAVRGMTAARYRQLAHGASRHITALPSSKLQVDVNYMSAPVLASITSLTNDEAARLVQCRDQSPWFNAPEAFVSRCAHGLAVEQTSLTAQSQFYLFQARAKQGDSQHLLTCLLEQVKTEHGYIAKIVWQEWNDV